MIIMVFIAGMFAGSIITVFIMALMVAVAKYDHEKHD